MPATAFEAVPENWVDERDDTFFRLVAGLFSSEFLFSAGVLLASYDPTPAAG